MGLACRQSKPTSVFDLPGRRFGAPLVAWLFVSPLLIPSLGVDGVCADPEDVFLVEPP